MKVLVINCGSSSLKFQLIDAQSQELLFKGLCERIGIDHSQISYTATGSEKVKKEVAMPDHKTAVSLVLTALTESGAVASLSEIDAVGHRIVHGGEKFTSSVVIDEEVIGAIEEVSDLAPLHNPANIIGIRACMELMPGVPMVAVFDTAFHQTMPEEAYLYGLPYSYYTEYGIRRYGFHGTSHSYVSKKVAEIEGKDYESIKTIVCHLGNGASVSAVKNGKCVDTSMGLTPLEGLIMGTRSGAIDPSVVEMIEKKTGKDTAGVMNVLNKESGVYGLSGNISSDFRDLEDAYIEGNENAIRAVDCFVYQVVKYIGAYAAAMGGVDCIAFTAGVGENSGFIRKLIVNRLGLFDITLNEEANKVRGEEKLISMPGSKVNVYVVPTNEELAIAKDTYALLA
ncbi:acetate/propionate family kinase [Butyrivibrio sp. MC2013]|uniref:acetate/propionate family kinase n=1 Tax=Butyrivibrio sp. MC2013 TaxID=1280686 RepID=UPI0004231901|nr:acetate kinase [Butyrivibrio sp. MC2013]